MNDSRRFLSTAIASALDFEVMKPKDVFQHVTMEVLAHHLPVTLRSRLLTASLEADSMTPTLILDTLGVDAIAEHVPVQSLWQCVAEAATRSLGKPSPSDAASDAAGPAEALPPAPDSSATPAKKRKPNRSARASRVRAGATSRSAAQPLIPAVAPTRDSEDSAFDVDTRVGADPSAEGIDDGTFDPSDEVTAHGPKN